MRKELIPKPGKYLFSLSIISRTYFNIYENVSRRWSRYDPNHLPELFLPNRQNVTLFLGAGETRTGRFFRDLDGSFRNSIY